MALAESFQPRLVLLGRSPAPGPEPAWRAAIHDEAELKRVLIERCAATGASRRATSGDRSGADHGRTRGPPQPGADRGRRLGGLLSLGGRARRRRCPHRPRRSGRAQHGPVRGLIHGAGALADRRITDQTDEQFDGSLRYEGQGASNTCWRALTRVRLRISSSFRHRPRGSAARARWPMPPPMKCSTSRRSDWRGAA